MTTPHQDLPSPDVSQLWPPLSRLQNLRHIAGDGLFQVAGLGVERFEFLVERFELLLEVLVAHVLARSHADVAARVERPSLRFDFLDVAALQRPGTSAIFRCLAEDFLELRLAASPPKVRSGSSPR